MWREKDQEAWKHFTSQGEVVSCSTKPQAQEYIDKWSKTFPVLVISRPYLNSIGLSASQVNALTDEDMARIAETIAKTYPDFEKRVRINVKAYLLK